MNAPFLHTDRTRRGFTMTELVVVIGVIAVLAGILLSAMGGVRRKALATTTLSTMTEFSKACDAFQLEHGRYPGVVPENVLAAGGFASMAPPNISGTENALLELMGGVRIDGDPDYATFLLDGFAIFVGPLSNRWELHVDRDRIGEGPLINGRQYAPYFTPSESMLRAVKGQLPDDTGQMLPDLIDAWGQPIVYVRRARPSGPLTGDDPNPNVLQPQFYLNSMWPYTRATELGKFGEDQTDSETGSILNNADQTLGDATFAQILRHPSLGSFGTVVEAQAGTSQGAYILFSSGPDGIYFSKQDGPGTPQDPIDDIVTEQDPDYSNPTIVKEYDDIRVFGGG